MDDIVYFVFLHPQIRDMIQEIKIKNFLSFKDEVTFSFEATKDTFADEYQVFEVAPGVRLLRFAMVYGANASGKSNLLSIFRFLGSFWRELPPSVDMGTETVPFLLDHETPNKPSEFGIVFYVGNTKYWYQLVIDKYAVLLEKLFVYNSVQPTMLFDRGLENGQSIIHFGTPVKISAIEKEKISVECLKNMSFFAARNKVNVTLPEIDAAKQWLLGQIMPVIVPETALFEYAERQMTNDARLKAHLLGFLKQADFNITDVKTDLVKEAIPEQYLSLFLNDETLPASEKDRMRKEKTLTRYDTSFEHAVTVKSQISKFYLPKDLESLGTRRTFGIETAVYYAQQNNAFLAIDEVENSLHPKLLRFILLDFLRKNSRSQLMVTTHYDPLLNDISKQNDQRIFRKDSVWFTEKLDSGHTDVYSLAEFRGLNRLSSIQKAYNQGNFGAVPQIDL